MFSRIRLRLRLWLPFAKRRFSGFAAAGLMLAFTLFLLWSVFNPERSCLLYIMTTLAVTGLSGCGLFFWQLRKMQQKRQEMEDLVETRTRDLTASMQRYQVLTETMRDVAWIIDPETFKFVYVSSAVEELLGFTVSELVGWSVDIVLLPEDRAGFLGLARMRFDNFRAGRTNAQTFFVSEMTCRRKDGAPIVVETVSRYCWNLETGIIEMHGVSRDITHRKRIQNYRDQVATVLQILSKTDDFGNLLQQIATLLFEKTGCNRGVRIRMKKRDDYPVVAYAGITGEISGESGDLLVHDAEGRVLTDKGGRPRLSCICGMVLAGETHPGVSVFTEGGSCWSNDVTELSYLPVPSFEFCTCERFDGGSLALIPIRARNDILGLIQLRDDRTGMFLLETVEILEEMASHIGAAFLRKQAERNYRILFHSMLEGYVLLETIFDDEGSPQDFGCVAMNPAFEKLLGDETQKFTGESLRKTNPQFAEFMIRRCENLVLTGEPVSFIWRDIKGDRYFEVSAFRPAPNQVAALFIDVTERFIADQALHESQRQYKSLLSHLQGMAYRMSPSQNLEFASDGAMELTGFEPYDLVDEKTIPYLTLIMPQDRQRVLDCRKEAILDRHLFEIEYEINTRDRKLKWVVEQGGGIYDNEGNCIAIEGFINDITGRKRAAVEQERLLTAIEQSSDTVLITDVHGIIRYANQVFEHKSGYKRSEIIGKKTHVLNSGIHGAKFYRKVWKTILSGKIWRGEITNRNKQGGLYIELVTITPVNDDTGEIINFVSVQHDITEEKKTATALAESEYRYRTLADSGTSLIWTSGQDKHSDWFNRPWLEFVGMTLEQALKKGWSAPIAPQDVEEARKSYSEAFDRQETFSIEYRLRHRDGGYRWVVTRGTPRFDLGGQFLGYIAHGMDISDLKHAEEEREKILEQLLQSQKMESIGRLAGGVAHDFNNMLQAIIGYTELAMEDLTADESPYPELLEIKNAALRSAALTGQLQAFASKQTVMAREMDLNANIDNLLNMLRRLMDEDISLQWKPGKNLHSIYMDPGQVDQLLVNLCINARDALGAGGQIMLRTENVKIDSPDTDIHRNIVPGDYVMLSVSDNGTGMPPELLDQIFEPFFTTKKGGTGTGLGLSTVYGIVRQNKGGIQVLSSPGSGSEFRIYLPGHEPVQSQDVFVQEFKDEVLPGDGEYILLVEDEELIINTTRKTLASLGYEIKATRKPEEALQIILDQEQRIDLLITDIVMPVMNGTELAQRAKEARPDLKVLFISGYTANLIAEHGLDETAINLLLKPFSRKELSSAVRQVLDGQTQ